MLHAQNPDNDVPAETVSQHKLVMQELKEARDEINMLRQQLSNSARPPHINSQASQIERSNLLHRRLLSQERDEYGMRRMSETTFTNDTGECGHGR